MQYLSMKLKVKMKNGVFISIKHVHFVNHIIIFLNRLSYFLKEKLVISKIIQGVMNISQMPLLIWDHQPVNIFAIDGRDVQQSVSKNKQTLAFIQTFRS